MGANTRSDRRHKGEGIHKENGNKSDHHEELGEAGVVMRSGALEELRCQEGHLGVHVFIDYGGEQTRRTRLTTSILDYYFNLGGGGGGGGGSKDMREEE